MNIENSPSYFPNESSAPPRPTDVDKITEQQYAMHYGGGIINMRQILRERAVPERSLYKEILNDLELTGDETLLDAGCGDGRFLLYAASHGHSGQLVGVNNFPIYYGTEVFAKNHKIKNIEFSAQDVRNLEFEDSTFDAVTCLFVLYHVGEPNRALEEFRRVLKPDGKLIVATRNTGDLKRMWEAANTVAEHLGAKPSPSFYDNYDITAARKSLEEMFEFAKPPVLQTSEVQLEGDQWEDFFNGIHSTVYNWDPPVESHIVSSAINELIKPVYDEEVNQKGYFTDYVYNAYFVCLNSKKPNSTDRQGTLN